MKYGYTRTSTDNSPDSEVQRRALRDAGVPEKNIHSDTAPEPRDDVSQPAWHALDGLLGQGDELVICRMDRLGRSMIDAITTVDDLLERGVLVQSVSDGIDPSTREGLVLLRLVANFAEYERGLTNDRTQVTMGPAETTATEASAHPNEVGSRPSGRGPRSELEKSKRPPLSKAGTTTKRPARIPSDLYQRAEPLIKGVGRPSWGQLIWHACATQPEQVIEAVLAQLQHQGPLTPRGANRAGAQTTPILPRFLDDEIAPVNQVRADAQEAALSDTRIPTRSQEVSATAVIIAAIHVQVLRAEQAAKGQTLR